MSLLSGLHEALNSLGSPFYFRAIKKIGPINLIVKVHSET